MSDQKESKCVKCMTCGMHPRCCNWIFRKIKYDTWPMTLQMVVGVCCSMSFVLTAMGLLISMNTYIFGSTIYNKLDQDFLTPQDQTNFMALATRVAEQVELWEVLIKQNLLRQTLIIEQMLDPTYFQSNLEYYPLIWDDVQQMTFAEVQEQYPDAIEFDEQYNTDITRYFITYVSTEERTDGMKNFEKLVSNQYYLWLAAITAEYGINNDVMASWVSLSYFEPDEQTEDSCAMTVMDFPGVEYGTKRLYEVTSCAL